MILPEIVVFSHQYSSFRSLQVEVDPSTNQDQLQQFTGAQSPLASSETSSSEEIASNEETGAAGESGAGEEEQST